jgi:GntR family transcriptional regulator
LYAQVADALRADIRAGTYAPGAKLPSERALIERFDVSAGTIRAALVQLRAEGLVVSYQGRGVYVTEQTGLRRLSTDITTGVGFYSMTARSGERPTTVTEVRREAASEEVAQGLGVDPGTEVVVRHRVMGTEEHPLVSLATSYFPVWVTDAAPNLADPNVSGLPKWLREAFGDTYSDDLIDARMPTAQESDQLEIPEGTPVLILTGRTYDAQHRVLHYISKVTVGGRLSYGYRFGAVPDNSPT